MNNNYYLELTKSELDEVYHIMAEKMPELKNAILFSKIDTLWHSNPSDVLHSKWHIDDVMYCNCEVDDIDRDIPRCTEEQARDVLKAIEHNHDATVGINWDVIEYHLGEIA